MSRRDAERRGDVLAGELVPEREIEDLAIEGGEACHGKRDQGLEVAALGGGLRVAVRVGCRKVGELATELEAPLAAVSPVELVPRDRVEPGHQFVRVAKLMHAGGRQGEAVLHDVGRVGRVLAAARGVVVQARRVLLVEVAPRRRVAASHAIYQGAHGTRLGRAARFGGDDSAHALMSPERRPTQHRCAQWMRSCIRS